MTVQEILDIEKQYQQIDKPWGFNEDGELAPANQNEDISFLAKGYIKKHNNINPELKKKLSEYGLTDFEMLMLKCFEGFLSYAFKWESYEERNSPIPEMCEGLDGVLDKCPVYDEDNVLYRFCKHDDKLDFNEGEIYIAPHYVTTTKDGWETDEDRYIITPKKQNTNARSLYKLYNHGDENQVTFKRGTKFKVIKIEEGDYKKIYMEEL